MDAFVKQHCRAAKYDILSGGANEDLSSREGFHTLLLKGLRLMTFALVMCGPPCSLFIFLSSSQHLRHLYGAMGSPWDVPTQLANIIAGNMACFLHIIKIARKPWIVVEQPKGSWLLKLPRVLDLISTCKFMRGHQLEKATTLVGDLPGLKSLKRVITKKKREHYKKIRAKKNQPPMYIVTERGVHGTRHLAKSAVYPTRFCTALAKLWLRDLREHQGYQGLPSSY
ncbi:unnamed protein product [Durusdinium trenchii]|uniref:Uncharacterized protein n=1 Tax=Durusdinium trenchii TaxID=1381693 RepID=A0ABP0HUJ0_9DINO